MHSGVPIGADLGARCDRLSAMGPEVLVGLTADEALVLFEWLHRMEAGPGFDSIVEDYVEKVALWNLSALRERELVESFHHDYTERVAAARVLGSRSRTPAETDPNLRADMG